jgi:peptidyl-tRNA hydrolase, PTH1 family
MKLIVGLGNPGFLYARHRHNVGFMCVSQLARIHRIPFDRKQGAARTGIGTIGGDTCILARPQTYMNASGESVSALMKKLNLKPEDVIVFHDDLDLPVGKIRVRFGGSSGGHRGIESIISRLGTREFNRIRIGIGRPEADSETAKEEAVISFVLSDFPNEEREIIEKAIPQACEAAACLISNGITETMNRFN